ncbi:hypothetical protein M2938_25460, partial [Klebsiella pneumoniae]|nr:hypothetical protein [Klebsiella pneumoniae]
GEINAGAELRSKNPLISLFGRWGLSGKVGIGNTSSQRVTVESTTDNPRTRGEYTFQPYNPETLLR